MPLFFLSLHLVHQQILTLSSKYILNLSISHHLHITTQGQDTRISHLDHSSHLPTDLPTFTLASLLSILILAARAILSSLKLGMLSVFYSEPSSDSSSHFKSLYELKPPLPHCLAQHISTTVPAIDLTAATLASLLSPKHTPSQPICIWFTLSLPQHSVQIAP